MGKNKKKWHLLLSHCRYFDKSFTKMFERLNLRKNIEKSSPQKPEGGVKLKLCRNVHNISLAFFIAIVHVLSLLMAT